MILSVDVDYRDTDAFIAGVTFNHWQDDRASGVFTSSLPGAAAYVPGEFYRRELPCILHLLADHRLTPHTIVIDGFVYLDGDQVPGLGRHLYDALGGVVTVVGVAKRPYRGTPPEWAILRGTSATPLYITGVGIPLESAKESVRSMHGSHRIPTLLRLTDQLCRRR